MDQDLNAAVEDFRRRIGDLASEHKRLLGLVADLEAQSPDAPADRPSRPLRRARADLKRCANALEALKRDYARFRLRQAVGHDPAHIDAELFDDVLLATTTSGLTRREPRGPYEGRIGFDTFRTLLLADLPLGQVAGNEAAERKGDAAVDFLQEETGTKGILRRWAAMTQSDAYVSDILQSAAAAAARFGKYLTQFTQGLDSLRINYELKQRGVDRLAFACEGTRPTLEAANYWDNIEQVCSEEVRHLLAQFHGVEQARQELRQLREELNTELRSFMACFVPRYITYVTRQTRARQHSLGLGRFSARRLCQYLLEQIERTDFLLPRGSTMETAVPRVPANIVAFRKTKSFQRYKKALQHAAMADASTIQDV